VRDFLVNQLGVKKLVIGYDHQFGKNREGSIEILLEVCEKYGFEVIEIAAQEIDEVNVSSTKIRNAIKTGDVETANTFLGEPFLFNGTVVEGSALGRELGYPTANIDVESGIKLIPGNGVYAVIVEVDGVLHEGMMNIGVRPTIENETTAKIEVHLFDFNSNLYGKSLTLQLLSRSRDEIKFNSLDELKNQLKKDEEIIRAFFSNRS